jgi:7-cyano-7-deazaguanine synthase
MTRSCLVVLSGGQDSVTCLAWAKTQFDVVFAITFDYGQRHRIELEAATTIARLAGVREHRIIPLNSLSALGGSAMLAGSNPASGESVGSLSNSGLPNTFVPGRNLLFLTLAAAWAFQLGIADLVTGVCQTDYSGYPDCREDTMRALQAAIRAGMEHPITIHTPLMFLSKADSVKLAMKVGGMELLAHSHTCYNGLVPPCGTCPACQLRTKGFAEAGVKDPLLVRIGVKLG